MEERQTNYTISEGYELPSKGLIYDAKINPHIELRSMTARDEMKRLAGSTAKFKVLCDIIEGCLIEKPKIHVYDMALGDYEYLLHRLRVVTYGTEYKLAIRCPHCGEVVDAIADLDSLAVKEFDEEKFSTLRNLRLPVSGDSITIKYQTPRMLDEIEAKTKELKRRYKDADIDFNVYQTLLSVVDEVNGQKMSPDRLETYINRLPANDMLTIIYGVKKLNDSIGIENTLTVDCTECGGEVQTFFRYEPEFFRPTTI